MIRRILFVPLVLAATGAYADGSPQWANAAGVDGAKCLADMKAAFAGTPAKFTAHKPMLKPDKQGCGMPQGVTVTRGPAGITWSPALEIDCTLAAELPKIEAIVQEEARALLGSEIKRIETLGAYACRTSKGPLTTAYGGKGVLSEHAFGLAIDLKTFVPKKGKAVAVAKDWGKDGAAGRFLANVRYRLRKETALTHVITPDYNAAHRDHLHVDRGLPWGWWMP